MAFKAVFGQYWQDVVVEAYSLPGVGYGKRTRQDERSQSEPCSWGD